MAAFYSTAKLDPSPVAGLKGLSFFDKIFDLIATPLTWLSRWDWFGRTVGAGFFSYWIYHRFSYLDTYGVPALWYLENAQFLLFVLAYLTRAKARDRAVGFWQTIYPLGTAMLPFALSHYDFKPAPITQPNLQGVCVGLLVIGISIQIVGIFYLRRSFSIMTEARELVVKGIYRFMRHPMYVGSFFGALGIGLYRLSPLNIFIFCTFLFCQSYRASREEAKLTENFPAYGGYRKRVWWF